MFERQEMFVASKLWNEFHKPEDVEPALRQSLMNLGLEYLDLFLMHWPFAFERQHQTKIIHPVDFSQKVSILKHIIQRDNKTTHGYLSWGQDYQVIFFSGGPCHPAYVTGQK